jgi:hypothetical protein
MAQRQNPPFPGTPPPGNPPAGSVREDRFDALLEERFSPQHRGAMARQLADHDRGAPAPRTLPQLGVRPVRAVGPVPERVRQVLAQWVPQLIAHAAGHGLLVRELSLDIDAYARAAYEQAHGPLAPGLKLPASSYGYHPLYKRYGIHLVLPEGLNSLEGMFTVLRAFLARLFGDIYLREEIFTLEAYREDVQAPGAGITVGMAEQLLLLEDAPLTSPELDAALAAHGQQMGMNARRQPGPVRKAFFQGLRKALDEAPLPAATAAVIAAVFGQYTARLRQDVPAAVREMVDATGKLNAQTTFLPPDETPEYLKLREQNPTHYLRAAKARLQFVLEAMGAALEIVTALEQEGAALTSLEEERVHGYLAELDAQRVARPYLLSGVRLSPEMERRKAGFPLEVHAIMTRLPPQANPEQRFKSLCQRIENSAYQRLYHAFMLLRHGIRQAASTRTDGKGFKAGDTLGVLKGLAANFRFRRPLLAAHFARMGVVLDLAEAADPAESKRTARFPVEPFSRAWGQFIAHALLADFLARRRQAGFDAAPYWQTIERSLEAQAPRSDVSRLALLLRRLQVRLGQDGIAALASLLRQPSGTLRFTLNQALEPNAPGADLPAQLERWVDAVCRVHEGRQRNAILPGTGVGGL